MSRSVSEWSHRILLVLLLAMPAHGVVGIGYGETEHRNNSRAKAVRALYIFGDSTADCGNNNKLYTIARSNFPPYGRDFDTRHATGRFSNGRMAADFVAEFLRIPLVPSSMSLEADMNIYGGVNFASAGAGILNRTGDILGAKISHWEQIELFLERRNFLVKILGEESAAHHLKHSLYYVAIGGNDFIHNYITNDTDAALLSPDNFNFLLLSTLRVQLQTLFRAGARKVAIVGIGPIGCAPHFLFTSNSTTGECLPEINELVVKYNTHLALTITEFNQENPGAHFIYRDVYNIVSQLARDPDLYGFTVGNTACCGVDKFGGRERCVSPAMVCDSPEQFVWWDEYHPSHQANHYIASQIWYGTDPPLNASAVSGANPNLGSDNITFMNLQQLVLLELDDSP